MKKLLIIGANNFQLPLILKAKEMGIETHVFAWEEGAVGKKYSDFFYPISITEKELILEEANKIQPDGIISIASDLASITVNYIAEKLGLIGNSIDCTNKTTNKYLMRKVLHNNGLPCPKFTNVYDVDFINNSLNFPLIVKPTDRSGSRGVTKVDKLIDLENAVERAKKESFNNEIIIEEFVTGLEYSIEMISWKGQHHYLQITEKETSGQPYFVEKGQHQPAILSSQMKENIIDLIKKTLTVLGVEYGASHSEIIITCENQVFITEIGARMGGDYIGSDLVELSTGFDFVKQVINISLGYFEDIGDLQNNFSGTYYIYPKKGRIINIIDNTSKYPEIIRSELYSNIGDFVPEIKESNDRPGCFIYKSTKKRFDYHNNILLIITE